MALTVGRTRITVHPLALMFPLLSAALGGAGEAAALGIALAVHEGAHLLAARCLNVGVTGLRLMPFGAAISMANPYALAPRRLFAVAAAGPLGSALALLTAAALSHWGLLSPAPALAFMRVNGVLMLFNLLPALPLDGGRMLWALLSSRVGRARAVDAGIRAGQVVAALLAALAVWGWFARGRFNLSLVLAAVFLIASGPDERRALSDTRIQTLLAELRPVKGPVPARLWAIDAACPASDALRVARPDVLTLYAVYEGSRLSSITDDRRLLRAMLEKGPL